MKRLTDKDSRFDNFIGLMITIRSFTELQVHRQRVDLFFERIKNILIKYNIVTIIMMGNKLTCDIAPLARPLSTLRFITAVPLAQMLPEVHHTL